MNGWGFVGRRVIVQAVPQLDSKGDQEVKQLFCYSTLASPHRYVRNDLYWQMEILSFFLLTIIIRLSAIF